MRKSKQRRQIVKLVQLLINNFDRDDIATISATHIANCLECPEDVAEDELVLLWEEGIVRPVYKIYCGACDSVMAYYEAPRDFTGFVECPYCYSQPENASVHMPFEQKVKIALEPDNRIFPMRVRTINTALVKPINRGCCHEYSYIQTNKYTLLLLPPIV